MKISRSSEQRILTRFLPHTIVLPSPFLSDLGSVNIFEWLADSTISSSVVFFVLPCFLGHNKNIYHSLQALQRILCRVLSPFTFCWCFSRRTDREDLLRFFQEDIWKDRVREHFEVDHVSTLTHDIEIKIPAMLTDDCQQIIRDN